MSTRDMAINIVNLMTEEQLAGFVSLFQGLVPDIPSGETIRAMEETEELLMNPNAQKFTSVQDLFEELKS